MPSRDGPQYVILGAGISGLALAWYLKKYSPPSTRITILEKAPVIGGKIQTDHYNTFIFERGPHSLRLPGSSLQLFEELFKDLEISEEVLVPTKATRKKLLYNGKTLQNFFPSPIKLLFPKNIKNLLLPLLKEKNKPSSHTDDETIYDFFVRRFNVNIANEYIAPMISGIYGGSIQHLSMKSCLPLVYQFEKKEGSLLKNLLRHKKQNPGKIISFKKGIATLPNALLKKSGAKVHLNSTVLKLDLKNNKVITGKGELYGDHFFSTLPASSLKKVIAPSLDQNCYIPRSLSYAVVHLGYHQKLPLPNAFGYLIAHHIKEEISGVIFDSKLFPLQDHFLQQERVTVLFKVQGMFKPKAYYIVEAKKALRKHLRILSEPDLTCAYLINEAISQYELHHEELRETFFQKVYSQFSNLSILGSSYYKGAVGDCILEAERIAQEFTQLALELPQ